MTDRLISLSELEQTREELIKNIHAGLTNTERHFLVGFKKMEPDWSLLPFDHIKELPAVK